MQCIAGFFNPKCTGVNIFSDKIDAKSEINGQTLFITASAFDNLDKGSIVVYATGRIDLSKGEAKIQMFKHIDGLITEFNLP